MDDTNLRVSPYTITFMTNFLHSKYIQFKSNCFQTSVYISEIRLSKERFQPHERTCRIIDLPHFYLSRI